MPNMRRPSRLNWKPQALNALKPQVANPRGQLLRPLSALSALSIGTRRPHSGDFRFSPQHLPNPCQISTTTSSSSRLGRQLGGFSHPRRLSSALCMLVPLRVRSPSLSSSAMASAYSVHHGAANGNHFTITALGRWSLVNTPLPGIIPENCTGVLGRALTET